MESERFVEGGERVASENTDACTDAFDRDRPNLLGLRFRIALEAGGCCGQEDLERIDAVSCST